MMSFYITLVSDQAEGNGQKFTTKLTHLHHLVEDDWEAALVHISHPQFNQPLANETLQNWSQEDSEKHWMKTDIKRKFNTSSPIGTVTKTIHLPPGYYNNLKEAWIAIAYEIEKARMDVMLDVAFIDDIAKRRRLVQDNLALSYVKIAEGNLSKQMDSLYVWIPPQLQFQMEWKMAGLLGLVTDGTPTSRTKQGRNYLLRNIVEDGASTIDKYQLTIGPVEQHPPYGHVEVSFSNTEQFCNLFLGPNLSKQPFTTTSTVKRQQGQQQLMIYTDLVQHSMVGNQHKGFLRTIDVDPLTHHFDATQLMYFPLRKNIFDTIHIDIQTANGQPAPFKQGNTVITLQLSRKSQRNATPSFISCPNHHGGPGQ